MADKKDKFPGYTAVEAPKADRTLRFRYFCDACTGIARLASEKEEFAGVCNNCGAPVGYNEGNWIALTKEEIRKYNA